MKRYAASYIYLSHGQVYKQFVVELEGEKVTRLFPLKQEIESTVWLDGIILLSSFSSYTLKMRTTFMGLLKNLCNQNAVPIYAYHLSGIELQTWRLLSSVKLTRL